MKNPLGGKKENLFNSAHKATNEKYRDGYDRIFRKKSKKGKKK